MSGTRPRWHGALWRMMAALAIFAQAVFSAASLADVHGVGASAHVEAAGINQHYTHNEATCPACTMAALSVVVSLPYTFVSPSAIPQAVRAERYDPPAEHQRPRHTHPRAPPV